MEEEKAAAYYDELTRKGGGAARFKHGLGFSSTSSKRDDLVPAGGSALPSSSSFLSSFVKASSPTKAAEFQKQAQLETIQNKLKKKPPIASEIQQSSRVSRDNSRSISKERDRDRHSRRRSRSRSRSRDGRGSRNRHRSSSRDRDRDRYGERERDRERRKRGRRSRSRSVSDEDSHRMRQRDRGRRRSRSLSPRDRKPEKSGLSGGDWGKDKRMGKVGKERNGAIDYAKLIEGYEKMSQAEKVKAKMKLQLSETAEKDAAEGMGSGWERFEFNKDAPLDDEEIEAVEDDAALVKHIGQSFRFSAVESRREEQIKAAHDKAMFGASSIPPPVDTDDVVEQDNNKNESKETARATSLISDKPLGGSNSSVDLLSASLEDRGVGKALLHSEQPVLIARTYQLQTQCVMVGT